MSAAFDVTVQNSLQGGVWDYECSCGAISQSVTFMVINSSYLPQEVMWSKITFQITYKQLPLK